MEICSGESEQVSDCVVWCESPYGGCLEGEGVGLVEMGFGEDVEVALIFYDFSDWLVVFGLSMESKCISLRSCSESEKE